MASMASASQVVSVRTGLCRLEGCEADDPRSFSGARVSACRILGALILIFLGSVMASPKPVGAAGAELYSGQNMVLHLSHVKGRTSEVKGVIYSREAAYKFEARRRGAGFRSKELYARNDRLAPYRKIEGTLELQVGDGGAKVTVEMNSPIRNMSAVFRSQVDARSFNLLTQYGENYCDMNHLVLLVTDRPMDTAGGWLSRVMSDDAELMPVIGLFFGPRVWYSFQATGDPATGISSSSLVIGDGALEGYLGRATLKARTDGNQLLYTYADAAGSTSYQLGYRSQDKLCARVITRWTARRRMPRGRVAEQEPVRKEPEVRKQVPAVPEPEEKPAMTVQPEKREPVERRSPVPPPETVTAPAEAPSDTRSPAEAREERLGRKKADLGTEEAAPQVSEDLPLLEGEDVPIPDDLLLEEFPTDLPADIRGEIPSDIPSDIQGELPADYPTDIPSGEYLPEGTEPLPGDEYLYPEGQYYEPLPGEEYLDDPLYQDYREQIPLDELPAEDLQEPIQ